MSNVPINLKRSITLANVQLNFLALYCNSRLIHCPPKLELRKIEAITKDVPARVSHEEFCTICRDEKRPSLGLRSSVAESPSLLLELSSLTVVSVSPGRSNRVRSMVGIVKAGAIIKGIQAPNDIRYALVGTVKVSAASAATFKNEKTTTLSET